MSKANIMQSPDSFKTGKYRHYKGGEYQVIDTAIHSETEELLVVYRPLYGQQKLWVRPYAMFFEKLLINGNLIKRFEYMESE